MSSAFRLLRCLVGGPRPNPDMRSVAIVVFFLFIAYSQKSSLSQEVGPSEGIVPEKEDYFDHFLLYAALWNRESGLTEFVTLTTENVSSFQFKDLKVLKNVRGTYYACLMIIIVALFCSYNDAKYLYFKIFVVASQFPSPCPHLTMS